MEGDGGSEGGFHERKTDAKKYKEQICTTDDSTIKKAYSEPH